MSSFLALDFETSDYPSDSACSIGMVLVENGVISQEYTRLIRPPREIMRFTDIHGIRWSDVKDQPNFGELWSEFLPFFEKADFIVAHNAPFDRGVLAGCCERYGITVPNKSFQCTVQVARKDFGIRPAKLSNVCKVLGIELNHHEALSDARACAQILLRSYQLKAEQLTENFAIIPPIEF